MGTLFLAMEKHNFFFVYLLNRGQLLTPLHSEQPKLYGVLAVMSANRVRGKNLIAGANSLIMSRPILKGFLYQESKQTFTKIL